MTDHIGVGVARPHNTKRHVALVYIVSVIVSGYSLPANAQLFIESNLSLSPSLRHDELDWNIAGDEEGNNPNVLSELKWEGLKSLQLQLASEILINRVLYLKGFGNYGFIIDGDNQDSDYLGDDRTLEFSRSNNDAGDGNVLDVGVALGMVIVLYDNEVGGTLTLIPHVGYSVNQQHLRMTDGYQTIPATGSFPGLDSEYNAQWDGPWVGVDMRFQATWTSAIHFRYEYHVADYYADANWNLRDDFAHPVSFEHVTEGTGHLLAMGWREEQPNHWVIGFEVQWQRWTSDNGVDRTFAADGSVGETRLNEVNWNSASVTFVIGKFFPVF